MAPREEGSPRAAPGGASARGDAIARGSAIAGGGAIADGGATAHAGALDPPAAHAGALDPPAAHAGALVPVPRGPEVEEEPELQTSDRRSDVDRWGRSEHMREVARKALGPIYRNWFRVEWEGLEKIPEKGGALLVANHAGAIPPDAMVIMHGIEEELGRPVYGMADYWFRSLPFVGTLWNRAGGVAAHPDNAYGLLHDDESLALVFPEGTKGPSKSYRDRYQLRRFGRGGFVEIAMRAGVPIVPVAVIGAEEAMPILYRVPFVAKALGLPYFPITANQIVFTPLLGPLLANLMYLPAKFRIRVLEPLHFDVAPDQERYGRARVMDEAELIRQRIQDALWDMLRHRRSVWFG